MEINYIILGHKNPNQISRLVNQLSTSNTNFYIHIDKSTSLLPFITELENYNNVYLLDDDKRISVGWGDISMIIATLICLKKIVSDEREGYCVMLSGQDYPIKNSKYIEDYFEKYNGQNFIDGSPIPYKYWDENGMPRILYYNFHIDLKSRITLTIPSIYNKAFYSKNTLRGIKRLLRTNNRYKLVRVFKKRGFPKYVKPYAGSQWWALPINTIKFILTFIERNPSYLSYHKYTHIPDEIFFPSIVFSNFDQNQIMPHITYVDWSKSEGPYPTIFELNDFNKLNNSSKLFARKFDYEFDKSIFDKIDEKLLQNKILL